MLGTAKDPQPLGTAVTSQQALHQAGGDQILHLDASADLSHPIDAWGWSAKLKPDKYSVCSSIQVND